MNILDTIRAQKIREVEQARRDRPLSSFERIIHRLPAPRGFLQALEQRIAGGRVALIAEIKRASPSQGIIKSDFDAARISMAYQRGDATCLCVVTDESFFQGSAQDFIEVKQASCLPLLRKDFIIDPYQVYEARSMDADCIVLILSMLSDAHLARELAAIASQLEMDVLIEITDAQEAELALSMGCGLIGINNRNLSDFSVDLGISERLFRMLPPRCVVVSESGISTPADVHRLLKSGIRGFLIGEQLMRACDIEQATRSITSL